MNLANIFKISLKSIWANKVRSFLTMLGVIIGVSSVVMLISIGRGLEAYITDQFESLGSNNIFVSPGEVFNEEGGFNAQNQELALANIKFDLGDVRELKALKRQLQEVAYYSGQSDDISFLDETKMVSVVGTSANYPAVLTTKTEKGRFYSETEVNSGEKVVVLGYKIYEELFGEIDPLGKRVQIGSHQFEVVGVAEEKGGGGSFGGPGFDTFAYIPFETLARIYDNDNVQQIVVKARPNIKIQTAIAAIEDKMLLEFDDDEFSVYDQSEILNTINNILGMLTVGLGGIAAISLVVGGVGIMNIMLVSVTERTKEIGLRKALGATPKLILLQFLIESALVSVLGGLLGLGLAFAGSLALNPYFPAKVTSGSVLLAFGVSTAVGLIFGAAPARRASKLSPIEALRYE
jgi:putative ABC transport system permease protein